MTLPHIIFNIRAKDTELFIREVLTLDSKNPEQGSLLRRFSFTRSVTELRFEDNAQLGNRRQFLCNNFFINDTAPYNTRVGTLYEPFSLTRYLMTAVSIAESRLNNLNIPPSLSGYIYIRDKYLLRNFLDPVDRRRASPDAEHFISLVTKLHDNPRITRISMLAECLAGEGDLGHVTMSTDAQNAIDVFLRRMKDKDKIFIFSPLSRQSARNVLGIFSHARWLACGRYAITLDHGFIPRPDDQQVSTLVVAPLFGDSLEKLVKVISELEQRDTLYSNFHQVYP